VAETLEAVERGGGREAALYMDEEEDEDSDRSGKDDGDASPFGGGTMVVSKEEKEDKEREKGRTAVKGTAQFSEWLEKDAPAEYAKMSTEELQKMLGDLEGRMAQEIQLVHARYADMREKITERISKIE